MPEFLAQTSLMININLLPEEYRKKKINYEEIFKKYKMVVTSGIGVLVAVIVVISLVVVVYPSLQKRTLRNFSKRWKNIEKNYEDAIGLKKERDKYESILAVVNKIIKDRILWAEKLNNISDSLPKEIQITELKVRSEELKDKPKRTILIIAGIVPSYPGEQAIGDFIKGLREIPSFAKDFSDIEPPSTETLPSEFKKFGIKCYTVEKSEKSGNKKTAPAEKEEDEFK